MNFSVLSDLELELQTKVAVTEENKAKTKVLHLLREVERRRLYSKSHPSLFEYCVKVLKYSSGAAQRRIDTMRAMKLIPEIENKLISGELNMTSVSQAQVFFRQEAKLEKTYSINEKKGILSKLENKSTRECIETLIAISPNAVHQEKRRVLTPDKIELKLNLDKEVIEKLDRIKALMSHKNPHMTDGELINALADLALQRFDPTLKKTRINKLEKSLPAPEVKTRYIPAALRKSIWLRDKSMCVYKGCRSTRFLEIDHIIPIAQGGTTELSNLRLLCRAHNQRAAMERFGIKHMEQFRLPDLMQL